MRIRSFVILGLAGTFIFGACSSSTDEKSKALSNSVSQGDVTNSAVPINSESSNTASVSNGMIGTPQAGDANAAPATSSDSTLSPNMNRRFGEKITKMGGTAGTVDEAALAIRNARPAPDNSTFASYLTDVGHEIRTFKNHPQLLKVEKRTESSGAQSLKIFLRNGNVVNLPGAKIPVLSTASAATISLAAGIPPPPVKQPAPGTSESKKPAN